MTRVTVHLSASAYRSSVWLVVAAALGLLVGTQPIPIILLVGGLAALAVLSVITPLAALVALLVLAPLRTLIATEAPYNLPLDIGQLLLVAFLGLWLVYRIARRQTLVMGIWSPVLLPVLGFFIAASLTAFSAFSLGAWVNEWLKWAQILVLMVVLLNLAYRRWQWLVFGLTLAGVANAAVGLYEFFGGSGALHLLILDRYFRAFGTFGQPNPFGGFMGLTAPLALAGLGGCLSRAWTQRRFNRRISGDTAAAVGFYGAASALLVTGVVISWSRGAWLAFGIAVLVMMFALPRRWQHSVALLLVAVALVGLLWSTGRLPASIISRINSTTEELFAFDDVRGVDITPENYAIVERLAHWQAALNMARSYPWLGVGMGNYEVAYAQFRLANWKFALGHAHNYYLNVLAEAGIIGLVAYLGMWVTLFVMTWRARRHPNSLARFFVIGLLGTWTYLAVHSLTDNLYVNNLFLHTGVMLGVLAVLYNQTYGSIVLRRA